jgi:hypothetical protein
MLFYAAAIHGGLKYVYNRLRAKIMVLGSAVVPPINSFAAEAIDV